MAELRPWPPPRRTVLQRYNELSVMTIGMVEGLIARIRQESGHLNMPVLATGGLAGLFATATPVFNLHDTELTLRGLKLIFDRNHHKVLP